MEGTLSEIRGFAGPFSPRYWAFCSGQLLSIAQNQALFSLLGTIYGGDGRTTFALPDLRGRTPMNSGGDSTGPGLSTVRLGQRGGAEYVNLTSNQLPSHSHLATLNARKETGESFNPSGRVLAADAGATVYSSVTVADVDMSPAAIDVLNAGGSSPVYLRNPFTGINMIICTTGLFPSRN